MNPEESSIERLKRTLYSRNEALVPKEKRTPVQEQEFNVPTNWGEPEKFDLKIEDVKRKNNSFFNKFLIGSLAFFLLALGVALFIFFGGLNMISSNNLNIEIVAPSSISSGEELDIGLSIVNGNRADLENVVLFVDYPLGSQTLENQVISRERIPLGVIGEGKSTEHTIRTLLFGEKDIIKTFVFRIEYRVKGSNAVFSKEKSYDVVIGSSPVLLEVSYPKEVNSGQQITLNINITSNSSVPLQNALVKIEYPYGFTYKSSNIKPVDDNSVWKIGDLKDGDKKTLSVTGVILGQNQEERSFLISLGQQTSSSVVDFDTTLAASTVTLGIRKSFFDLNVFSDQGSVIQMGQVVSVGIRWQNTLPDRLLNNRIEAVLSGNVLNKSSVSAGSNGFYRSQDNTVLWDKNTTTNLANLGPGGTGQVSVNLASLQLNPQTSLIKNPYITVAVKMIGDRSGGEDASTISSTEEFTLKVASAIGITAKSFRDTGAFANTGPIPPKAETESTYTITWTLTNTTSDLKDTVVSAILPTGVEWKGQSSPSSERVVYDPDNRTVRWELGNVSYGTGYIYSPKEMSFKVGIIPSVSQVGSAPTLITQTNVRAIDIHTESTTGASAAPVTTRYSDPSFSSGKEVVGN